MTPIATTTLTGSPRTGTLQLPPPRGAYRVTVARTSDTTARLTADGVFPGAADMILVPAGIEGPAYWWATPTLDGYQWGCRADAGMRVLELFDCLVQRVGWREAVDAG